MTRAAQRDALTLGPENTIRVSISPRSACKSMRPQANFLLKLRNLIMSP